jgi:hypothetical protein
MLVGQFVCVLGVDGKSKNYASIRNVKIPGGYGQASLPLLVGEANNRHLATLANQKESRQLSLPAFCLKPAA